MPTGKRKTKAVPSKVKKVKAWKEYRIISSQSNRLNHTLDAFTTRYAAIKERDEFFRGWDVITVLVTPMKEKRRG